MIELSNKDKFISIVEDLIVITWSQSFYNHSGIHQNKGYSHPSKYANDNYHDKRSDFFIKPNKYNHLDKGNCRLLLMRDRIGNNQEVKIKKIHDRHFIFTWLRDILKNSKEWYYTDFDFLKFNYIWKFLSESNFLLARYSYPSIWNPTNNFDDSEKDMSLIEDTLLRVESQFEVLQDNHKEFIKMGPIEFYFKNKKIVGFSYGDASSIIDSPTKFKDEVSFSTRNPMLRTLYAFTKVYHNTKNNKIDVLSDNFIEATNEFVKNCVFINKSKLDPIYKKEWVLRTLQANIKDIRKFINKKVFGIRSITTKLWTKRKDPARPYTIRFR